MGLEKHDSEALIKTVIGLAMKVHRELGMGFLEAIYANALAFELAEAGVAFEREKRIPVFYRDHVMGDFIADLIIDEILVVELKSVEALMTSHSVQLVNYLSATRLDMGLLLNFGAKSLQFKTKTREYIPNKISLIPSSNSVNSV
jgi:GxxExxY protein